MKYLTFTQLRAKLGGRARSSIYLDVEAGRLPAPIKLGGRLYWCEDDVDERLRTASSEAAQKTAKQGNAVLCTAERANQDDGETEPANGPAPARRSRDRGRLPFQANQRPSARRCPPDGESTE